MEEMIMYDSSKVMTGLLIFLFLMTSPVWYNAATGKASYTPDLKIDSTSKTCIESTEYMRANHMEMLYRWRDEVVRGESRIYTAHDGKEYDKSLTNTCMHCHVSKTEFCTKCHDYAAVKEPKCWNCHNEPKI
jgi:[DsrC]-trisulfide reductase subunit J